MEEDAFPVDYKECIVCPYKDKGNRGNVLHTLEKLLIARGKLYGTGINERVIVQIEELIDKRQ